MRLIGLLACLFVATAHAQTFPNRPIRIVVPFAIGGSPDVIARGMAAQLDGQLGKNVIIDNRAGGEFTRSLSRVCAN